MTPQPPLLLDSDGDIVDADGNLLAVTTGDGKKMASVFAAAQDMLTFAKQVLDYAADSECFYLMSLAENIIQKAEGKS